MPTIDSRFIEKILNIIFGLFGVYGVYLVFKSRNPGRITFIKESCIGLFESITRNLSNLEILYRQNQISEAFNLALLQGTLLK
jgi:hypothetical protein